MVNNNAAGSLMTSLRKSPRVLLAGALLIACILFLSVHYRLSGGDPDDVRIQQPMVPISHAGLASYPEDGYPPAMPPSAIGGGPVHAPAPVQVDHHNFTTAHVPHLVLLMKALAPIHPRPRA